MKVKFTSFLCAFAILVSLFAMPVSAAEVFDENTVDIPDIPFSNDSYDAKELEENTQFYDLTSGGAVLGNFENNDARSASSVTQEFSGYITEQGAFQYVPLNLSSGQIVHATLRCPENRLLDYDLMLCSVDEEGNLTPVATCGLDTYVDPDTGKTVDESLSYIHNQASTQTYAVVVLAVSGSSETDPFTLTVSLDVAGSYDDNEPNDNAFKATQLNLSSTEPYSASTSASLNVVNDQDWYVISIRWKGPYEIKAGNYSVKVYSVQDENALKSVRKSGGNFILGNDSPVYYIKVFSNLSAEDFAYGPYTLTVTDQSKYASFGTAFDLGDWTSTNRPRPGAIPSGQYIAYYKFDIGPEDKVYASITRDLNSGPQTIALYDASGEYVDSRNSETGGVITSASGRKRLIIPIDGSECKGTAYLCVIRKDDSYMNPSIATRLQRMSGTYKSSETATATNTGYSTIINCNLRNTASIPETAVVESVKVSVGYSTNVSGARPGMVYYLRPEGRDWFEETNTLHKFDIGLKDNINVRGNWQFRVYQTVYLGNITTKYLNLTLDFTWYADIAENNYDLFGVSYG